MNRYNKGFPKDKKFKLTFRLSANKKQRNSYLLLHKASYIDGVAYKTVKVGDKIYIPNN